MRTPVKTRETTCRFPAVRTSTLLSTSPGKPAQRPSVPRSRAIFCRAVQTLIARFAPTNFWRAPRTASDSAMTDTSSSSRCEGPMIAAPVKSERCSSLLPPPEGMDAADGTTTFSVMAALRRGAATVSPHPPLYQGGHRASMERMSSLSRHDSVFGWGTVVGTHTPPLHTLSLSLSLSVSPWQPAESCLPQFPF
jgi:hypothetical protein